MPVPSPLLPACRLIGNKRLEKKPNGLLRINGVTNIQTGIINPRKYFFSPIVKFDRCQFLIFKPAEMSIIGRNIMAKCFTHRDPLIKTPEINGLSSNRIKDKMNK